MLNIFKLENRIVLDAAAASHVGEHREHHTQDVHRATETYIADHRATDNNKEHIAKAAALLAEPVAARPEPVDVVLVSNSLPDYQTLVAAVKPEAHIIVYDAEKETPDQVIEKVKALSSELGKPVDSVTLLSHGGTGDFQLGNQTFTAENIADNAKTWGTLEHVLSDKGQIYLFGCNVNASGEGQLLLDKLADATGAKVFASDDTTGKGGDWVLEASSYPSPAPPIDGEGSSPPALSGKGAGGLGAPLNVEKLGAYSGQLAALTLDIDANDSSGVTGSDFKASFTEGQGAVNIADSDPGIKDAQNGVIKSATITLTNPQGDRQAESLKADTANFNIKQTYNAATGVLTLDGLDKIENYQQVLKTVQYNNSSRNPDIQDRVITFSVEDAAGNKSNLAKTTLSVAAVNNAPVILMPGGGIPYSTKSGALILNKNAMVSDVDSVNFNTGQMVVKFSPGADVNDKLGILNGGDGGNITVSGSTVSYQGQAIATFSGGTSSAPLTFSLNDRANPATVQSLARSLTYENVSTSPTGTREVQITVSDDKGAVSNLAKQVVSLSTINNAPVNTVPGLQTILEGGVLTFNAGNQVSIWDGDAGVGTLQVTVSVLNGILKATEGSGATISNNGSVSVTLVGMVDQINAALNGMTYQPSNPEWSGDDTLTITTDDRGNTGDGGAKRDTDTVGIKVLAVNDPPFNVIPVGQSTSVDTELPFASVNSNRLSVNDPDAGANPIQVSLSVANGTLNLKDVTGLTVSGNNTANVTITGEIGQINQSLDGMKYKPAAGWSGTDTLKVVSNDKGFTGEGGAKTAESSIEIAVVPKTPFNVSFTEGDPPIKIADQLTVSGVTSGVIKSAKVTILNSQEDDKTVESLTAATSSQFNIKQTYNAATGVLTLDGIDSVEHYQQILRSIAYNNTSSNPNPLARTISIQITSSDDTVRDISATTLNVKPVNNPPTLTLPGGTFNYIGTDPVLVNNNAFVSDVDSPNFDTGNLTVSFSKGSTAADRLGIRSEGTGTGQIGVSGNQITYGGTVIATFSGGTDGSTPLVFNLNIKSTPDNIQALVRNITYTNTVRNPAIQEREIQFVVTDGDGGTSATQIQKISVLDYNEPPVNTVPGAQTIDQNTAEGLVFSPAKSNTISIADPDAEDKPMQVLLSVQNGTLKVAGSSGLTVTGDGSGSVILVGSQTQINAALNGLLYRPLTNWNGDDMLSINTNDQGNTGLGGAKNASDGVVIHVRSVNDPPVNHLPDPQVVKENSTLSFRDINSNQISVSDPDAEDKSIEVKIDVGQGTLTIGSASGVTISGNNGKSILLTGSQTAINTALNTLDYKPPADFIGGDILTMTTNDKGNTGEIGGEKIVTNTLALTVAPPLDKETYFVEGKGAVNISPEGTMIEGVPMGVIKSAKITLTNPVDTVFVYKGNGVVEMLPSEILKAEIAPPQTVNIKQSYDPKTGVLTLEGLDTVANYEKILHQIFYDNISENPTKPERIFTYEVTGADGNTVQLSKKTGVYVVPADNPPFLKLGDDLVYAEEGDGVTPGKSVVVDKFYSTLDGIIDVDYKGDASGFQSYNGGSLTVQFAYPVTNDHYPVIAGHDNGKIGPATADDYLAVTDSGAVKLTADNKVVYNGQVIATVDPYTPENGLVIHFNENSTADPKTGKLDCVQAVVDAIAYGNKNPQLPHHDQRLVNYTLYDGGSPDSYAADPQHTLFQNVGQTSSSTQKLLELIAINDPPANYFGGSKNFPTEPLLDEKDQNLVFSDANGNRITVGDPDAGNAKIEVTLTVDHSTFSVDLSNPLVTGGSVTVDGNNTATIVLKGSQSDINQVLNGLTYVPTQGFTGIATVTITTNDKGNTGVQRGPDGFPAKDADGKYIEPIELIAVSQFQINVMEPPTPHRNEGGNPIPWSPPEGVVNPPAIRPGGGWGPAVPFPGPVEPNGPWYQYGSRGLYGNPCGTAPLYPCCTLEEVLRIGCRFAPAIDPEARVCNVTWEWMESIGWNVPYGWHGDYIAEEYDLYKGLFLREPNDKGFNVGAGELAESFGAVQEALDALRIRTEEYDVYSALFLKRPGGETFNDFGPGELKQAFYNGREQLDKSAEWCPAGEPYKQQQS